MQQVFLKTTTAGRAFGSSALLLALLAAPIASHAQTATLFGAPANFDVYNDTGQDAHGFEIELDGLTSPQVPYYFSATRYGAPTIVPFQGGVYVRYAAQWNPVTQQFTATTTIPAAFTPTNAHSCVLTNIPGCDHYGIVMTTMAANVAYHWLVADPQNPGQLMPFAGAPIPGAPIPLFPPPPIPVPMPHPIVQVIPQPAAPPVVVFQIKVPPPPPAPPAVIPPPPQFGDAKWVKVYKTELQREVGLDELVGDNPIVPQDPALVEIGWKLLQFNPHSASSGVLTNQGAMGSGSRSVIRRYEFYKYSGQYDPLDHSALCADPTCSAPGPGELGNYVGSQMAAANVGVPSITVSKVGSGTVNGVNGQINCGGACTTTVAMGATVTLAAIPPSNAVFSGWSGACNGAQPTCSVTVNDALNVTATFTPIFTLSIGRGGNGTVTGNPGVLSTKINCGGSCSAKFMQGTTVTLTATPAPGLNFVNWTGSCSGIAPTCDVTITKDTQVQANFK